MEEFDVIASGEEGSLNQALIALDKNNGKWVDYVGDFAKVLCFKINGSFYGKIVNANEETLSLLPYIGYELKENG